MSQRVIPLESNPEVFSAMAARLGLTPVLQFHDVLAVSDPELLAFLPQPVYGLVLLFPITARYEADRAADRAPVYANENLASVRWFKQTIGNACGLYALLHLLANVPRNLIVEASLVDRGLLAQMRPGVGVDEVSRLVAQLEATLQLDNNYGVQGQTEAPASDAQVELHFLAFVKGDDNHVYELDGRRNGPVDLGVSAGSAHLLDDTQVVDRIQFYMDSADDANRNNFAVMALAPSLD